MKFKMSFHFISIIEMKIHFEFPNIIEIQLGGNLIRLFDISRQLA